ncbi:histidinol-phosphate transaminase [Luteimonas composti]|uniref:Histidinol-phosphate aminotransferase n=1 Tax=Luteimonas composti TaxID=398257 RepID=A0ABT6MMG2_9GAMM|nr:histidinol-phosphate transaminase [Luteimonas composti]MDH7451797.1 histidinol-phosphate transaminase [Luteimonas composti]
MSVEAPGILALVREDLRDFAGYSSARSARLQGEIWLNANESAWANAADVDAACRRYPDPQPADLRDALCALYGVRTDQLLVGRGSDEAIDLLVRATCTPGRDAVLVTPPVFGMYAVSARLQGAPLVDAPLRDDPREGLVPDFEAIERAALARGARLVFLCSPSNPGGAAIPLDAVATLARRLADHALVVVDEAYGEFSDVPSATSLLGDLPNLVVLRTLSKAHALAAARIGVAIAAPELISVLRRCQAPYPVPDPVARLGVAALSPDALARTRARIDQVRIERARLFDALSRLRCVRRVYPSQGNFLLVRFEDADAAFAALLAAGVVVRDQRAAPSLGDALRITVGTPAQNDRVLETLATLAAARPAPISTAGGAG